jgi:aryl-alcohol dehydrogenase-like predicted oxidoreductase
VTIAARNELFLIGGDRPVRRLGFGAMQLTGPGIWGPPGDRANAVAVLRHAVDLGVNFIDTADVYGPGDNERLIREALYPYPPDLVIATKAGLVRSGPGTRTRPGFSANGTPTHIRRAVEGSLRDLGLERIDLYQLHRVDPATPMEETMEVFRALREEGKIKHIGLSEVSVEQIERARAVVEIATVQNVYSLAIRKHDSVLAHCESSGIGFIPFWPLHLQALAGSEPLVRIADQTASTPSQVALAWLLKKSAATLLIPGTSSVAHLEENVAAREVEFSDAQMRELEQLGKKLEPKVNVDVR